MKKASRRTMEVAPRYVAEISRRARRERSEAVWRLLLSIFSNRSAEKGPMLCDAGEAQGCS